MLISFFLALAETDPASDWIRVVFIFMISFRLRPDCWAPFLLERQKHLRQHRFIANWLVLWCEIFYGSNRGWLNGWKKVHDTSYWRKSCKLFQVGKSSCQWEGNLLSVCESEGVWPDYYEETFCSSCFSPDTINFPRPHAWATSCLTKVGRMWKRIAKSFIIIWRLL